MNFHRFWSGPLMNEAGGGTAGGGAPASGGGAPAGGGESTALVPSGGGSVALAEPSGGDDPGAGGDLVPGGGDSTAGTFRALEKGKFTDASRNGLKVLSENGHGPLSRYLQQSAMALDRIKSWFPGKNVFNAVNELRKTEAGLLKMTGETDPAKALSALTEQAQDIENSDTLYAAGDARLLHKMTQTPAAKAAFAKLMPNALAMWEDIAPNQFTVWLATQVLDQIKGLELKDRSGNAFEARIPEGIALMARALPVPAQDGTVTTEQLQRFYEACSAEVGVLSLWLQTLNTFKQLQPENLAPAQSPNDSAREQQLAQREAQIRQNEWVTERNRVRDSIVSREWKRLSKDREISSRAQENIEQRFLRRLERARQNQPDYRALVDSRFRANDRNGYLQDSRKFYEETVPRILESEMREELGTQTRKAASQKPAQVAPQAKPGAPTAQGRATRVSAIPNPNGSDLFRGPNGTTSEMLSKKQGIASARNQWGVPAGTMVDWSGVKR